MCGIQSPELLLTKMSHRILREVLKRKYRLPQTKTVYRISRKLLKWQDRYLQRFFLRLAQLLVKTIHRISRKVMEWEDRYLQGGYLQQAQQVVQA